MVGVHSGIKAHSAACADVEALEKRRKVFVTLRIEKVEGSKVEKL